jgi:hypothetical protein
MSAEAIELLCEQTGDAESVTRPRAGSPSFPLTAKAFLAKAFLLNCLGMPHDLIADRLMASEETVVRALREAEPLMRAIQKEAQRGMQASELAVQHNVPEPLIWSLALQNLSDGRRFERLRWGLRTWDYWNWGDVDPRFGDDWPGRIPAQLVGHTLFYFTNPGDLVFDPMAGGGVVPDTCLAFGRRCRAFDAVDRGGTRPEIERYHWDAQSPVWPSNVREKPDLIFFDPPYFAKKDDAYCEGSISGLSRHDYLTFFRKFLLLAYERTGPHGRFALLAADWRAFLGQAAMAEIPGRAITVVDYGRLMEDGGWAITHIIDCPLSTARFWAGESWSGA